MGTHTVLVMLNGDGGTTSFGVVLTGVLEILATLKRRWGGGGGVENDHPSKVVGVNTFSPILKRPPPPCK